MALTEGLVRYICLFHNAEHARAAVAALESAAVAQGPVTTLGEGVIGTGTTAIDSLADLHVPERDVEHLQEGLQRGGVVVSLEAPEDRSDEIEDVFHRYSASKIDEADVQVTAPLASALPATNAGQQATGGTVLPVAEESLVVGKRAVDRGGVRVLRHTVAEPVSETVDLHSERVVLEYRETNRPATEADLRAGSQQIELVETAEVPVVQKVARVVEEVHVGKVESDRTEVVQDAVRHTEVQVENVDGVTDQSRTFRR